MTTAIELRKIIAENRVRTVGVAPVSPQKAQAVQAVGGVNTQVMSHQDLLAALAKVHGYSGTKGVEDGTRVHIHYKSFGVPTPEAIRCAKRAAELDLPRDRYTGRVHRVWTSSTGDQLVTLWVELERDHMYRTLNFKKGEVYRFLILGE